MTRAPSPDEARRSHPRGELRPDITAAVPSDALAQWHVVLRALPALAKALGVPNQLHLVIDANIAIAEVRWMVKKRNKQNARTSLQEVIASGTVIAYAPPLLRVEVEKRLRTIAQSDGLPLKELMTAWASYEPLLRFVEPPSLQAAASKAAARDPNDAAYFELQVGIDAAAVYTSDPDLHGMGAPVISRHAVTAARDFARAASISFTFRISGVVVLSAGIAFLVYIVRVVSGGLRAVRRLPSWVLAILGAACVGLLMHPRSRAWLLERFRAMGSAASAAAKEIMPLVATAMEQTDLASVAAQNAWSQVDASLPARASLATQPLHVHVLTICARAQSPLTTEEIAQAVRGQGYKDGALPSRTNLLRVLRSHSALMRTGDKRWQIRAV